MKTSTPTSSQNAGPTSVLSEMLCGMFETLPADQDLRVDVLLECRDIIKKALEPVSFSKSGKRVDVPYLRLVQAGRPAAFDLRGKSGATA